MPLHFPTPIPGQPLDGSTIATVARMHALVYFGKGDYRVVPDRPLVATEHDVIAKVLLVHRCGTDVKIFQSGRPDQAEESLLEELAQLIASPHPGDSRHFLKYVTLLQTAQPDNSFTDPLYLDLITALQPDATRLPPQASSLKPPPSSPLLLHWGRIFGHETVVQITRVGQRVHELTEGIGYMAGQTLSRDYLNFREGELCCLQSRIAHYHRPLPQLPGAGVQLLGGNITDLAMNQAGAFAQYVRIRPQVIQSGSVLRVPAAIDRTSAALVEPLACLLDCFQKTTHELGQDDRGSILRKGVLPQGLTLVIGSGSMAMMAGKLALTNDPLIDTGPARQVVFAVRSPAKRGLVLRIMNDPRVSCLVAETDEQLPATVRAFKPTPDNTQDENLGKNFRGFRGFDDVILAAGNAKTVAIAHELIAPTGARIMTFAGTRGPCPIESGLWHYANATVLGTSGCNTKMMEVALGLLERRSIDLRPLSGRTYTFADLARDGAAPFFTDQHLRPKLDPNAGLPEPRWE